MKKPDQYFFLYVFTKSFEISHKFCDSLLLSLSSKYKKNNDVKLTVSNSLFFEIYYNK